MEKPKIVSPAAWIEARKAFLVKEKEFTKVRDALSKARQALPWERVEKDYVFDGPNGKETFSDLFEERHQLIVYHFMFGPDWDEGCPSCSYLADHFNFQGAAGKARSLQETDGMDVQVGLIDGQRFQSRLQRVVHRRRVGARRDHLQL